MHILDRPPPATLAAKMKRIVSTFGRSDLASMLADERGDANAISRRIVRLRVGSHGANGFLTLGANGELMIVTAAHAVSDLATNAESGQIGRVLDELIIVSNASGDLIGQARVVAQADPWVDRSVDDIMIQRGDVAILEFSNLTRLGGRWLEKSGGFPIAAMDPRPTILGAFKTHVRPGCSGSPVFNEAGTAIGVLVAMRMVPGKREGLLSHVEPLTDPAILACLAPQVARVTIPSMVLVGSTLLSGAVVAKGCLVYHHADAIITQKAFPMPDQAATPSFAGHF